MTPRQLLAREPIRADVGRNAVYWLVGCYFNHLPEAGDSWEYNIPADADLSTLEWHEFGSIYIDHRRYHSLAGIKFRGEWVMIITNAGREGDDHSERFVLNPDLITNLATTIDPVRAPSGIVDLDTDLPSMTVFYGRNIFEGVQL